MGVDVHIIIKNDFADINDKARALEYVRQKVESIKKSLSYMGYNDVCIEIIECEGDVYFNLPPFGIPKIHLHAGFWEVWSNAHHLQLTIHNGSDFHIRKTAYELAKLFDQRKAWYCKDEDCEDTDLDFFHWMQFMIKKYGGPKDYNINEILRMEQDGCDYVEPHPFYHDTFLECKIDDELQWSGFSIEDLTPDELEQLIYEIREKDKGCMFLDGVLASKPRYT